MSKVKITLSEGLSRLASAAERVWWRWAILSFLVWLYVLATAFIIDLGGLARSSELAYVAFAYKFRFLFFFGRFALALLVTSVRRVFLWISFTLIFPVLLLLFIAYRLCQFGGWTSFIGLASFLTAFFRGFRSNVFLAFLLVLLMVGLATVDDPVLAYGGSVVCVLLILLLFVRATIAALRPSKSLTYLRTWAKGLRVTGRQDLFSVPDELRGHSLEALDENAQRTVQTRLELAVGYNRACIFLARKVLDYKNSSFQILSETLLVTYLLVADWLLFAMANAYLHVAAPEQFLGRPTGFFTWLYYSFSHLVFSSIHEIAPAGSLSQSMWMAQAFLTLYVLVLFVTSIVSRRSQVSARDIAEVVRDLENEADEMEEHIKGEFGTASVETVIAELKARESSLVHVIAKMRGNLGANASKALGRDA